ncbi:Hypp1399 [Branchiostoma lanceolatum]|uniref:Hypp1399 protein n=1 Tax=Branchiostoma lanceolatum TaxID=7740 RepID=A0A8K0ENL0_BRALA|nr:Hypp1399 [Branchiostoma lanceolatum]
MSVFTSLVVLCTLAAVGAPQKPLSRKKRPLASEIPMDIQRLLQKVTSYEQLESTFNLDIVGTKGKRFSMAVPPPCTPPGDTSPSPRGPQAELSRVAVLCLRDPVWRLL